MQGRNLVCGLVVAGCVAAIAGVCWHSVEEIHYLKTFYPARFTVEEAFWASGVELIKMALIALPLLLIAGVALWLWGKNASERRPSDPSEGGNSNARIGS